MKNGNTIHYAALAMLLALLTFFFYSSQIVDPHAYAKINNVLQGLEQDELSLGQNVLKNQSNLLHHYDPLVVIQRAQATKLNWLQHHSASLHLRSVNAAMDALQRYISLSSERQGKIEQFKASHAVLHNSLNYLPLLVNQLHLNQNKQVEERDLMRLLADVLLYQQQQTQTLQSAIERTIHHLQEMTAPHNSEEGTSIESIVAHAGMIMRKSSELESLLLEIMKQGSQLQIQQVRTIYQHDYQRRLQQSRLYQLLMFTAAILLMIYAIFFLLRLRQSRESLRKGIDEVKFYRMALDEHAIVVATDLKGVITYANQKSSLISGYEAAELIGKSHSILNSNYHSRSFFKQMWLTIEAGKPWHGEIRNRCKDGSFYWVNTTIMPELDASGRPVRYVAIRTDITEQKEAEERLLQHRNELEKKVAIRTVELNEAKEEAEFANRQKSEFLANMSHELRTPLNAIIGFSDLLKDDVLGEMTTEQKEFLGDIHSNGEHLLSLINDILDLSKVEAGHMELEVEVVNVDGLLQSTLAMVRERAMSSGIQLTLEDLEGASSWMMDVRRMKQVVINLLSNAIKFTHKGGKVTVRAQRLGLAELNALGSQAVSCSGETYLCISVSDTGIGIRFEDQKRLFQPFVQLEGSMSRKYKGTGLGLALCRKIVELHDGHIWLTSKEGQGSNFYIALPTRISPNPDKGWTIVPWSQLLRHFGFLENTGRRCHSPFALLRLLPAEQSDASSVVYIVSRLARSHEMIAQGEKPGEILVLMLNANDEQAAAAEQRFCAEMERKSINVFISHAACPAQAPDADALLEYLKRHMHEQQGSEQ